MRLGVEGEIHKEIMEQVKKILEPIKKAQGVDLEVLENYDKVVEEFKAKLHADKKE